MSCKEAMLNYSVAVATLSICAYASVHELCFRWLLLHTGGVLLLLCGRIVCVT
jgi:hypothetical protein